MDARQAIFSVIGSREDTEKILKGLDLIWCDEPPDEPGIYWFDGGLWMDQGDDPFNFNGIVHVFPLNDMLAVEMWSFGTHYMTRYKGRWAKCPIPVSAEVAWLREGMKKIIELDFDENAETSDCTEIARQGLAGEGE